MSLRALVGREGDLIGGAEVKLPAEPVDQYQRPGFITVNDAGIEVCENRLSYLVAKGGTSNHSSSRSHNLLKTSTQPSCGKVSDFDLDSASSREVRS